MNYFNIASGCCLFGATIEAACKGNYKMMVVFACYTVSTFVLSFTK